MNWPPQNTGLFAVAFCAQCTVAAVDVVEFNFLGQGYREAGLPPFTGDNGFDFYLSHSWGGSLTAKVYTSGDCAEGYLGQDVYTYAGACVFDPGTWTWSGGVTVNGADNGCGTPGLNPPAGPASENYNATTTATAETLAGTGACYASGGYGYKVTGTATATLGTKWTEADGIALSEAPGWTGWEAQGQFPDPLESQSAAWEAWGGTKSGGLGYEYHRAQFRRTRNGFNPGAAYDVTMEVYRKAYPAGAWALYATLTDTITADESGALVWSGEIPIARGYASWVKAVSFSAVPAA